MAATSMDKQPPREDEGRKGGKEEGQWSLAAAFLAAARASGGHLGGGETEGKAEDRRRSGAQVPPEPLLGGATRGVERRFRWFGWCIACLLSCMHDYVN